MPSCPQNETGTCILAFEDCSAICLSLAYLESLILQLTIVALHRIQRDVGEEAFWNDRHHVLHGAANTEFHESDKAGFGLWAWIRR